MEDFELALTQRFDQVLSGARFAAGGTELSHQSVNVA
jgi:hypothetical protein